MGTVHVLFHPLSRPFSFSYRVGCSPACLNKMTAKYVYAQLSTCIHFDYCVHSCLQICLHLVLLLLVSSPKAMDDHLKTAVKLPHVELHGFFLFAFLLLMAQLRSCLTNNR